MPLEPEFHTPIPPSTYHADSPSDAKMIVRNNGEADAATAYAAAIVSMVSEPAGVTARGTFPRFLMVSSIPDPASTVDRVEAAGRFTIQGFAPPVLAIVTRLSVLRTA
jgi:hypothetical protein